MKRHPAAYTLIEVLIAAAILMIAAAAAAVMALTTVTQEEINARITRCANLQEQAVRLYQLGLEPATVSAILPADPAQVSLVFTTGTLTIPSAGATNLGTVVQNNITNVASCTVEQATCTMVYITTPQSGAWVGGTWTAGESSDTARRTNDIIALRPALR